MEIKNNPFLFGMKGTRKPEMAVTKQQEDKQQQQITEEHKLVELKTSLNKHKVVSTTPIVDNSNSNDRRGEAIENIKSIKQKKVLNMFSYKEIEDMIYYKNRKQIKHVVNGSNCKEEEEMWNVNLKKERNELNKMKNNVYVVKPQIAASQKQINYETTNDKNYLYLMMKNKEANNKSKNIDKNEVDGKIKQFNLFVDKWKQNKYIEKLENGITNYKQEIELLEQNMLQHKMITNTNFNNNKNNDGEIEIDNILQNRNSKINLDNNVKEVNYNNNFNKVKSVNSINSNDNGNSNGNKSVTMKNDKSKVNNNNINNNNQQRMKKQSFCEMITNFLLGDPYRSLAKEKRVWGSELGVFSKEYQDHRISYNNNNNNNNDNVVVENKSKKKY